MKRNECIIEARVTWIQIAPWLTNEYFIKGVCVCVFAFVPYSSTMRTDFSFCLIQFNTRVNGKSVFCMCFFFFPFVDDRCNIYVSRLNKRLQTSV